MDQESSQYLNKLSGVSGHGKSRSALPPGRSYLLDTLRSLKDLIDEPATDSGIDDDSAPKPAATSPLIESPAGPTDDAWLDEIPVLEDAVSGHTPETTDAQIVVESTATAYAGRVDLRAAPIPELGAPLNESTAPQTDAQRSDAALLLDPVAMADRTVDMIDAQLSAHYERTLPAELSLELRQMLYVFLNEWIEGTERSLHQRLADRANRQ